MQFNQLRFQDARTKTYPGSPSIVLLPGGELLASHDYFGPGCPANQPGTGCLSSLYRSEDDGQSWALAGSVPSLKGIGDIVAADNGALYAGTPTSACVGDCDPATSGGEFYVSKDGGQTWGKSASQWTPGGNGSGWKFNRSQFSRHPVRIPIDSCR